MLRHQHQPIAYGDFVAPCYIFYPPRYQCIRNGTGVTVRTGTQAAILLYAAARVVYDHKPYDHVTPALKALHWLETKQGIEFKLCLLVHLAINNTAPVSTYRTS